MNEGRTSTRGRRGRVLFVGDRTEAHRLGARLRQPPVWVPNVFEAIGELMAADATRPFIATLVADPDLPPRDHRAAEAMRRLDPAVPVIRVIDRAQASTSEAGDAFDDYLAAPIDAAELGELIGADLVVTSEASEPAPAAAEQAERGIEEVSDDDGAPAPTDDSAPADDGVAQSDGVAVNGGVALNEGVAEAVLPPMPIPDFVLGTRSEESGPVLTEDLGDTDLLDAVMSSPHGVRETALALIRQQTGWADLELVEAFHEAGTERASAGVRWGDHVFGRLACGSATRDALQPWARWPSRWLTLDETYRDYRMMAFRDELTGAWNRRYFNRFMKEVIAEGGRRRRCVTVMVFDIDDFKHFNDTFGHDAGDVILTETVELLNSVIRTSDRVCRIGGDEFAVIFADIETPRAVGSTHPDSVESIARRFQKQIAGMRFPKLGMEAPGRLSISAGLATFPWDGYDPATLLRVADQCALESKRKGKNYITFGPGRRTERGDATTGNAAGRMDVM